ncbi:pilus assembly protein [Kitasatospora sp. NBC_01287]|uniref:TadE/TadG family type IV pilus assembly protein n=1 Tax=Kitasatospora sp. NBC_01287 TaxID=2903573 RepID=UPI002254DE8B|nr:TadE/TadG family type IV pilus assembly protein [Kitasatospora sp. NBC_01287]MCX4745239.1 pilus assembly protein [Kitasatospora sp. NBC_01287]
MLSISFALVFPVIVLLVLLVVQVGVLWYSESVALAAAREGADAARSYGGTDQDATDRVTGFLKPFNGLLGTSTVGVRRAPDDTTVTVTVRFEPLFLVPGLDGLTVVQRVQEPVERYVGP